MVSLTTYIKGEAKVILFTEIRGKECSSEWFFTKEKGDSVIVHELKAIYLGLSHINRPVELEIYTGHRWVVTAINTWIKQWQQDDWVKSGGKPVKNKELWQKIAKELNKHKYIAKLKEEAK